MKVKSEREVAQSCPTPSDPMDYYCLETGVEQRMETQDLLFLLGVFLFFQADDGGLE